MTLIPEIWRHTRGLFDRQPRNLRASMLVILAFFTFAAMSVMLRRLNNEIPIVEVIFVRQFSALLLMAPIYRRVWPEIRKPHRMALHMMRGVTASGAMFCGLSAVMLISLANVTAIQMTEVIFATAFAAILLGEKVSARHWALTLGGGRRRGYYDAALWRRAGLGERAGALRRHLRGALHGRHPAWSPT